MKGGLAAMIDAARVVLQRGFRKGRLIVAAVVDEEYASIGADALVREWTADAAIVTEPTDLQIGVGHKGFAWIEIETHGRAAHGSRPSEGRDAIARMGRLLCRLERLDGELQSRPPHPLIGTGSLHASMISGGREWSSYPDHCKLEIERRTVPGESGEDALGEVTGLLRALADDDSQFEGTARLVFTRPAYEIAPGHALTRALSRAAGRVGCAAKPVGMSFWTDAAILGAASIPSVLFGPGGEGLHSTEEYVRIADVLSCRDVLSEVVEEWMS
jgi:acetylornithine deacetylase